MTDYLDENLLPLILSIKTKKSQSYVLEALDLDRSSSQAILITFGERIERFWNKVLSDSHKNVNHIEDNNIVEIDGKNRQIDHLFTFDDLIYYLESKCCLNFDSEKVKASNRKIQEIKEAVDADVAGYFVPVVSEIAKSDLTKYNNKGVNVYGVKWLLSKIHAPFTEEEYFAYLKEVIAPILEEKGL